MPGIVKCKFAVEELFLERTKNGVRASPRSVMRCQTDQWIVTLSVVTEPFWMVSP